MKFGLDVASNDGNSVTLRMGRHGVWDTFIDVGAGEDGLAIDWSLRSSGDYWCNPPYSNVAAWAEKCSKMATRRRQACLLVPSRTDTRWWHNWVMGKAAHVYLIKGRVKFDNGSGSSQGAPFPSAAIIYDGATYTQTHFHALEQ